MNVEPVKEQPQANVEAQGEDKKSCVPMRRQEGEVYERLKWNGWGMYGVEIKARLDQRAAEYINGKMMRNALPFIQKEIWATDDVNRLPTASPSIPLDQAIKQLNEPVINKPFLEELGRQLAPDQIRTDGLSRLTHIAGKNYRDLWRIRNGLVERAPDCVLLPNSHDDCVKIVQLAQEHDVILVPFGGGTTVTGGVETNAMEHARMSVALDLRRMNRLLSVDPDSCLATFETGAMGPHMDKELKPLGFKVGHDPDSFMYSTLGGWIAARSSGAMSNLYGDIENIVVAMKVVTPTGVLQTPRTSRTCGVDLNGLFIGSEGAFGIVTEATIKIEPLPEETFYGGYLFPSFETAFDAFRECNVKGIKPCVMRLYDEDDFHLSMAMSTSEHGLLQSIAKRGMQLYLDKYKGWNMRKVSLVIVGFEGTVERVRFQRNELHEVFKLHEGIAVGKTAGDNWQEKKYDLPYVRDFVLSLNTWADVFETSVLYSQAIPCWRAVKAAVHAVWKRHNTHGWIGCHTAHQYKFGCCLYFTYASSQVDRSDISTFLEIKRDATEAMLRHTGNLTHHHGIGYEHVPWMTRYMGPHCMDILYAIKAKLDPKNICNPGKLLPSPRRPGEDEAEWHARQEREQLFDKMGVPGAVKAHL